MLDRGTVRNYFEDNAAAWVSDAYAQSGHNYPTPLHRLRVLREVFAKMMDVSDVLDVGCGGGNLTFALAEGGKNVTGLDESAEMLKIAQQALETQPQQVRDRVSFKAGSLQDLGPGSYDALAAMGVVGYLPDDDTLFDVASNVLRPGGYAVISFRNRLFNLFSISHRTLREIEDGTFKELADEAAALREEIDNEVAIELVKGLHHATGELLKRMDSLARKMPSEEKGIDYSGKIEARQSTPASANRTAVQHGFETVQLYGIHPHWSLPALNEMLPSQIYNIISDSLIPLETQPSSLLWSSVFIGVFKKVE